MDRYDVFLSYSHGDAEPAKMLRRQLERVGLSVFRDRDNIRSGDLWLDKLQAAIDSCGCLVLLAGRDGVQRWIGAELQVALSRHFSPHDDEARLPIFPILLGGVTTESLPAFVRLFQATEWDGMSALSDRFLGQIREWAIVPNSELVIKGSPFVGLDSYQPKQADLFFGRQNETLAALARFERRPGKPNVRWLEINGNSGSGKSSLMNAGLLPLVDQGWLWPHTGFANWRRIGPMMPGQRPVTALAEHLARAFGEEMSDINEKLLDDAGGLAEWLRGRKPDDDTAFFLAIDQFEELFILAEFEERQAFDSLLATAFADSGCPLFAISTVRADFLDRFDDLPKLAVIRNRAGQQWTPEPVSADMLREIIDGPARLVGLDVSEVRETIITEARDEPGALPLVQSTLEWLWQRRIDNRLSGQLLTEQGGLAGILSASADDLLESLGEDRKSALELLFALVNPDPDGKRHTRRRVSLAEAVSVAGGGKRGRRVVDRLAGRQQLVDTRAGGMLRLITVGGRKEDDERADDHRWVDLIHETLIRAERRDEKRPPKPYWPLLWHYIEQHQHRALRRERLRALAKEWEVRKGPARLLGLAGWSVLLGDRRLFAPGSIEQRYLRWSRALASIQVALLAALLGLAGEGFAWIKRYDLPLEAVSTRWAHKLVKDIPMPELETISEGRFEMGSDQGKSHELPIRTVSFEAPFDLAKTETTFEQYDAFAAATGRRRPGDSGHGREKRPVIDVNFSDAQAYATWLSAMTGRTCRLPSEAEWEYACRNRGRTAYISGDTLTEDQANFGDSIGGTSEVGHYKIEKGSPELWDMHGNVHEWVEDCWHGDYVDAPTNGETWQEANRGDCTYRVIRGGSWLSDRENVRCAARKKIYPTTTDNSTGFRVRCSIRTDN